VEKEGFPAEKVRVIPNGVDVQRFRPNDEARAAIRREFGLPPDAPVVGIVAALRPEKNHELFLNAAAAVLARRPEARFLLVGDGPRRGDLERQAAEGKLQNAVRFAGSRSDVPALLAAMDVFALTSHNEANPVSILEAMAVGLPVVATHVGSVAESVADRQTGYLVAPGAVDETAARWLDLIEDQPRRRTMGDAGRCRIVERWSLDVMVEGYQDLITEIYQRKTHRAAANERRDVGSPSHAAVP
jgi:glycosyltransferase involved in cell wall biosynthesis